MLHASEMDAMNVSAVDRGERTGLTEKQNAAVVSWKSKEAFGVPMVRTVLE